MRFYKNNDKNLFFPPEYYIDCIVAERRSELIIHENPILLTEESKEPMSNDHDESRNVSNIFSNLFMNNRMTSRSLRSFRISELHLINLIKYNKQCWLLKLI